MAFRGQKTVFYGQKILTDPEVLSFANIRLLMGFYVPKAFHVSSMARRPFTDPSMDKKPFYGTSIGKKPIWSEGLPQVGQLFRIDPI